ncbi:creatininase family protein [bacterium]|nr:creatininase family protein [bacterium]
MKLEEMKPNEIDEMLNRAPIVYIPWGSLEWHGVQNPIGLDALKVYYLCLRAAERTGGVVFPPVFCGYETMKPYLGFKKTIEISKETVQALAREYLEQLYDEGFRIFVILMGHYGAKHVEALKEVCQEFLKKHTDARGIFAPDPTFVADKGIQGGHADLYETSLMMFFRPDLVDLSLLPQDREITIEKDGIGGADPRNSSKEEGERIANFLVAELSSRVEELMKEIEK